MNCLTSLWDLYGLPVRGPTFTFWGDGRRGAGCFFWDFFSLLGKDALGTSHYLCRGGGGGGRKNRGAKAILNEQRGGAIVFFWYKDKGESYDKGESMWALTLQPIRHSIGQFITWRGRSALNCTRKPISHESLRDSCDIGFPWIASYLE